MEIKSALVTEGRSTGCGAITHTRVIAPDGSEVPPDRHEASRSGNHWTDYWYRNIIDCLVLTEDISNSGKDHSSYVLPQRLTDRQYHELQLFAAEHWLDVRDIMA